MSIPIESDDARFERFHWVIRLAPLVVAMILAALWIAGSPDEVPDLRLSAPVVARPGSSVGLRAWQIDRDDEGYTVIRAPEVTVELRNEAGLLVAEVSLRESRVHGMEGTLRIPEDVEGDMSLVARARIDGDEVIARRTLYVRPDIESRLPSGREVNAFQVYELGVLRVRDPTVAPAALDPRIEEGACVPDLECTLIVWVGDWKGVVRLSSIAGIRDGAATARADDGFVRFPLMVRGPEGRALIEALGDTGRVLAQREVRLPVVPGGLVARTTPVDGRLGVEWQALGGPRPVLIDVFQGRRWLRALSLSPGHGTIDALPPGVWRLQIRADVFSDNTASVVYASVGDDALRLAANAVVAGADREGLDPLALAVLDGSFTGDADAAVRALFAVPSFDVVAVGTGVSSRIGIDDKAMQTQDARRWQAAGAILLVGIVVSLLLLRVETIAHARARQILDGLPSDDASDSRRVPAGRGLWAFVLFVFVMIAVLALSKRWF